MKIKVTITEISHDDLVDLISTAFTYSTFLVANYDSIEYKQLPNADDGNLDQPQAEELVQYIMFGESIYG